MNIIIYNVIVETLTRIISASNNIYVKVWDLVWINYHKEVDGYNPIPVSYNYIRSKDPSKAALVILWNNGRALLDRSSFRKWYNYDIPQA